MTSNEVDDRVAKIALETNEWFHEQTEKALEAIGMLHGSFSDCASDKMNDVVYELDHAVQHISAAIKDWTPDTALAYAEHERALQDAEHMHEAAEA